MKAIKGDSISPTLKDAIVKAQVGAARGTANTGENNTSTLEGKTLKPGLSPSGDLKSYLTDNNPPTNPTNSNNTLQ